jgi:hypothetical protein
LKAIFFLVSIVVLSASASRLEARLHLFLDERLRGSSQEQVLYKFIPLTSAQEVDLTYVSDFLKPDVATAAAQKLGESDRGIYIGADRWPGDSTISALLKSNQWFTMLGKISFLIENDAPEYAALPRGLYPRSELWRKYAQLTGVEYAGLQSLHYLDNRPVEIKTGKWQKAVCIASSATERGDRFRSPIEWKQDSIKINFRDSRQLAHVGHHVCINAPGGQVILELRISRTDLEFSAVNGRFSAWNEAQPLRVSMRSDRSIWAPLHLKVTPLAMTEPVDIFFQGDRIDCSNLQCRPKAARFLLPQSKDLNVSHEFAIRSSGNAYFRGMLQLMAGSIEVARTEVRFTPHSWLNETFYALSHPSEYQGLFLMALLSLFLAALLIWLLVALTLRALRRLAERKNRVPVRQSSASLPVRPGMSLHLTALDNPFQCELLNFGGIVDITLSETEFEIRHGTSAGSKWPLGPVSYRLPDGYMVRLRALPGGEFLLDVFLLSEKDSSQTSVKLSQNLQRRSISS